MVVEELKRLPRTKVEQVMVYVHQLRETDLAERRQALAQTAGCMTPEEAEAFQTTIEEHCEWFVW